MSVSKLLFHVNSDKPQTYLECSQMQNWDIVVDADAIPAEKYAAEEFQRLFEEATGITLPVSSSVAEAKNHVYIGQGTPLAKSGVAIDTDELGEEELCVVVQENLVAIVGGRPRGTLYGVYQFLEDGLGVRFLTVDHTHVPDATAAKIPCGEYTYEPPFSFRWSYYRENSNRPDFAARLRVNTVTPDERLGGNTPQNLINHSFHMLVPFGQYGEENPEYYALVDGERDTNTGGGGPQLCVTNPEVIQVAAESAIRFLDEHPGLRNISVSQADTARYCRCDACEELNQREESPMGSQLTFVNAVAELIEPKHPDVKVGTLAYWYTRKAPKTIRPRHNVQIQLCSIECCTFHPIDDPDCPKNQEFCRDMNEWGKISNDIWVWNYNTNFRAYDRPFPNLRSIGPNVRYFLSNNVKGLFMQANGNGLTGELSDLRNYIIANTIWNPGYVDDEELREEFIRLHYKDAAPPIWEYIEMLHDNVEESGLHPGCFPSPEEVGLRPEIAQKAFDYFEQALELADDETVYARVEKASICAHRAMIDVGEMDDAERKALIDKYITICQRHNMTYASERQPASAFFEELRQS